MAAYVGGLRRNLTCLIEVNRVQHVHNVRERTPNPARVPPTLDRARFDCTGLSINRRGEHVRVF